MVAVGLLQKSLIASLGKIALLVEDVNEAQGLLANQVNALLIVNKFNLAPINFLFLVFFLLNLWMQGCEFWDPIIFLK